MSRKTLFGVFAWWLGLTIGSFFVIIPFIITPSTLINSNFSQVYTTLMLSDRFHNLRINSVITFLIFLINFNLSLELFAIYKGNELLYSEDCTITSVIVWVVGILELIFVIVGIDKSTIYPTLLPIGIFLGFNINRFFRAVIVPKGYIAFYKGVLYPERYVIPVLMIENYKIEFHEKEYEDLSEYINQEKKSTTVVLKYHINLIVNEPIHVNRNLKSLIEAINKDLPKKTVVGEKYEQEIEGIKYQAETKMISIKNKDE